MNLIKLLDYSNIIYGLGDKINRIKRGNERSLTKASTALKMTMCGIFTSSDSMNGMQHIYATKDKVRKSLFSKKEFIPKTTATRDAINDINVSDVFELHKSMLSTMEKNKVFENHTYRNVRVAVVDGVESFETHKNIEGLHKREHSNGRTGYYYKSLGISYLADDFSIMLDLVPFEENEVKDMKEKNEKIKADGEITVFKRSMSILKKFKIEFTVLDAMFLNSPCLNALKAEGIDAVVRLKDERRNIYKDAKGLFENSNPKVQYEVVEVKERKKVNYSKKSKKKNKDETETYIVTREVTDRKLNEAIVVKNEMKEYPHKTVRQTVTEKVLKRVKVWSEVLQLDGYNYNNGYVRVIKTEETKIENGIEVTKEMYLVTTKLDEDLEFIIDLMHKRWTIELNCFKILKSRFHMDHLFIGTVNAIQIITYLMMIVFNLIALYFNVHTKKYKRKMNLKQILEDFKEDLLTSIDMYKCFVT